MPKPRVKVNWSGGKDSTAAVLLNIAEGYDVVAVCYIPMFDQSTPLIMPHHLEFLKIAAAHFRRLGADVHFVHGITYSDFVMHKTTRGKNAGKIHGFPLPYAGWCAFARDSKIKALKDCYVGAYHWEDIGIAFDEPDRQKQLSVRKRSILVSKKITEEQARQICLDNGLLSPLYINRNRDGCCVCPHASKQELSDWFLAYPGSRAKLHRLQEVVKELRPDRNPLRGGRWFETEAV